MFLLLKDCSANNGNCGVHKCTDTNMGTMIVSECICNYGYQKSFVYDSCTGKNINQIFFPKVLFKLLNQIFLVKIIFKILIF